MAANGNGKDYDFEYRAESGFYVCECGYATLNGTRAWHKRHSAESREG